MKTRIALRATTTRRVRVRIQTRVVRTIRRVTRTRVRRRR